MYSDDEAISADHAHHSRSTDTRRWKKPVQACLTVGTLVLIMLIIPFSGVFYHRHHHHDATTDIVSSSKPRSCGETPSEAKHLGCVFDVMLQSWVPETCYDEELSEKFLLDGLWTWYSDAKAMHEVPLEVVQQGEHERIFAPDVYHRKHCVYTWQRLVRALSNRTRVDEESMSYAHTKHCQMLLFAEDWPDTVGVEITPGYTTCAPYEDWYPPVPEVHQPSWRPFCVHGILMCAVFAMFLPLGVMAVAWERWASVRSHWIIQTVSAGIAMIGIGIAVSASWKRGGIRALGGMHQIIGCVVAFAFVLQLVVGYLQHAAYLKGDTSNPKFSRSEIKRSLKVSHVLLGRSIYVFGAINATIGLSMGHDVAVVPYAWVVVIGTEALLLWFYLRRSSHQQATSGDPGYTSVVGSDGSDDGLTSPSSFDAEEKQCS